MTTALIFDLDGTLIDSRLDLATAVNVMRQSYHLPELDPEIIIQFIGNGVRELVHRSLSGTSIDIDEATTVMTKYYMAHLLDHTTCYSGVRTSLAELSQSGFAIAVVSNKFENASRQILSKLELLPYIDAVIGGDSEYPLKPEPNSILALLHDFNADPEESWILGDHYTDLEAGRRSGINRAWAAYGFGNPRDEDFDLQVDYFTEFAQMAILQKNLRRQ